MLYTVVLVACMANAPAAQDASAPPTDCRRHEMLIEASAIPTMAFIEAQTKAAEWLAKHPGLAQRSLTIRPGRSA